MVTCGKKCILYSYNKVSEGMIAFFYIRSLDQIIYIK